MKTFLEDIERFIEAEEETPEANVGDAPIIEDMMIKISFVDLSEAKQKEIKDELMKNMNATDEISMSNLMKILNNTPIFDGTVKTFRNQLGIENI